MISCPLGEDCTYSAVRTDSQGTIECQECSSGTAPPQVVWVEGNESKSEPIVPVLVDYLSAAEVQATRHNVLADGCE